MKNSDMPAMPIQLEDFDEQGRVFECEHFHGLTKREHFAGLAMQSLAGAEMYSEFSLKRIASSSIEIADALLKALEE